MEVIRDYKDTRAWGIKKEQQIEILERRSTSRRDSYLLLISPARLDPDKLMEYMFRNMNIEHTEHGAGSAEGPSPQESESRTPTRD